MSSGQEGRRSRIQRGAPGPARAVSTSARASERGTPAADAAAPKQPPPAPGARLPGGGACGDPLAVARGMAAPSERNVRSPLGHLPSGKRWGMDSLSRAPGLEEKTLTLWPRRGVGYQIRKGAFWVHQGHIQGT